VLLIATGVCVTITVFHFSKNHLNASSRGLCFLW